MGRSNNNNTNNNNSSSSSNSNTSGSGKKSETISSVRKNVKLISEKLKGIPLQGNLLQLNSIQTVLSALTTSTKSTTTTTSLENSLSDLDLSKECGHSTNNNHDNTNDKDNDNSSSKANQSSEEDENLNLWQKCGLGIFPRLLGPLMSTGRKYLLLPKKPSKSNIFGLFFLTLAFIFYFELHTSSGFTRLWLKWENVDGECTIESPNFAMELFRPPVSCKFCQDIKSADRVSEMTPQEFEQRYAYSGRPVVITDAMANWTATSSFTFPFFKSIYAEGSRSLEHQGDDCLFFPYVTEFRSLAEVFNMSHTRFLQPWYIGWSNCDAETSHILRQHYQRPYFLPVTAESTHADWIFMGTPGYGAPWHIDHVINPSWQAQIAGKKRWFLKPPPECYWSCESFQVDVLPGEIIVLDTNKWYHQTLILPGEMSITIGSEYD